ncbi:hypothetical protein EV141_0710 [Microcella putealis]|uniref:FHA domain-containing protein n=1 Tax=Microcella putealis TaxID=337005 RepID=A0A4Q7LXF1_9MICO|nr:hypothetical protein [Microcella putealis]RZS59484.1 hypothetical protein EV141_0710 [Microcella putealis]TQM26597.1 hypothetical protein BJ957_0006 [Microcella putealis]
MTSALSVEFCGERFDVAAGDTFVVGREGDLVIDDNPYLHRRFLVLSEDGGLWWVANEGSLLSATVSDGSGGVQAWLPPGGRLPLVFPTLTVLFSAGSTTYDLTVTTSGDFYSPTGAPLPQSGTTTIGAVPLTSSQRLLIVALAEHVLRQDSPGRGSIPSSAEAAERLGWPLTTFNRKLDNVCEKLSRVGVQGLRGERGKLATGRRQRLVEYAVASRLISHDDLPLLEREQQANGEFSPSHG